MTLREVMISEGLYHCTSYEKSVSPGSGDLALGLNTDWNEGATADIVFSA